MKKLFAIAIAAVLCMGAAFALAGCSNSGKDATEQISNGVIADGEYTIEIEFAGGSGKASVESPAQLKVEGGKMIATIVWSSSNFDKMVVDGVELDPVSVEENSVFEMNVSALDETLAIQAETTAMSEHHMIDYTMKFVSSSLKYA